MKTIIFFFFAVIFLMFVCAVSADAQTTDSVTLVKSFKVSTMDTITLEVDKNTKVDFINLSNEFVDNFTTDAKIEVSETVKVSHPRAKVVTPALVKANRYQMKQNGNTISTTNLNQSPRIRSGNQDIEDQIKTVKVKKPEGVHVNVKVRK